MKETLDILAESSYNDLMTNDQTPTVSYRFTATGSSPHQTVPPREINRVKDNIPFDSTDHWFLNTLQISQLDPTFPVGTMLTLEVPGGYVRHLGDRRVSAFNPVDPRGLCDSDRNILASLAHEACEPCAVCEAHVCMIPCNPPGSFQWEFTDAAGQPVCDECA